MRPPSKILRTSKPSRSGHYDELLGSVADEVYIVVMKEFGEWQPINLRRCHPALDGPGKYLRTLFSHSGFAFVLAEKLERAFPDDIFAVMALSTRKGRIITRAA